MIFFFLDTCFSSESGDNMERLSKTISDLVLALITSTFIVSLYTPMQFYILFVVLHVPYFVFIRLNRCEYFQTFISSILVRA